MLFDQEAKIQLLEKLQDMTELSTNYIMSLLQSFINKNQVNVS
jgi:hypothetical protein